MMGCRRNAVENFGNNLVDNKYWSNGKIISGGRYGLTEPSFFSHSTLKYSFKSP